MELAVRVRARTVRSVEVYEYPPPIPGQGPWLVVVSDLDFIVLLKGFSYYLYYRLLLKIKIEVKRNTALHG